MLRPEISRCAHDIDVGCSGTVVQASGNTEVFPHLSRSALPSQVDHAVALRLAMAIAGSSIGQVARALGVGRTSVVRLRSGERRLRQDHIERLPKTVRIHFEQLIASPVNDVLPELPEAA